MTSTRIETDPDSVERDLVKLVLTIVELLRQLMERQALRRVDAGDLSDDQEEQIGLTFLHLDDAMTRLCARYDLTRPTSTSTSAPWAPSSLPSASRSASGEARSSVSSPGVAAPWRGSSAGATRSASSGP